MSEPVISVEGLSKCYTMWKNPRARLQHPLMNALGHMFPFSKFGLENPRTKARRLFEEFWALRGVSFQIHPGECVGIVGRNGSGKSTLLQILAGTLQASEGSVSVRGKVAALLELGSGFNPEFTGRENIFLSAAVLGLREEETRSRLDEIIEFADIGPFVDQPLKTYSSGMMMRLAFAVNTCVDPEVLIVDEALAVGDAPFQAKCFRRLRNLVEKGISIILVSHDISTIKSLCHRVLWIRDGHLHRVGDAQEVTNQYQRYCFREQGVVGYEEELGEGDDSEDGEEDKDPTGESTLEEAGESGASLESVDLSDPDSLLRHFNHLKANPSERYGNREVVLEALSVVNSEGQPTTHFRYGEEITLLYQIRAQVDIDSDFMAGLRIKDIRGHYVFSLNDLERVQRLKLAEGQRAFLRVKFPLQLTHSNYILRTGVFGFQDGEMRVNGVYDYNRAVIWDVYEDAIHFKVAQFPMMPLAGPVQGNAPFELEIPPQ